jgi:AraC-like DNA-binding protein
MFRLLSNYLNIGIMKTKIELNDLLYLGEHLSCRNYMQQVDRGFKYVRFEKDSDITENSTTKNYLIFQLKGKAKVTCNMYKDRIINESDIILIPKASKMIIKTYRGSAILSLAFDLPHSSCDKFILSDLSDICKNIKYDFEPIKMKQPMLPLFDYAIYCFKNGMNCVHLHTHIEDLLFFIFRGYYSREELARLFYPIIAKNPDFKDAILSNLPKFKTIKDMMDVVRMGRTQFFEVFKNNFGVTAKQYMMSLMDDRIIEKAAEPNITTKDLMYNFDFDSQSHFYHYVKQHFGCTPKELIERFSNQSSIIALEKNKANQKKQISKKGSDLIFPNTCSE